MGIDLNVNVAEAAAMNNPFDFVKNVRTGGDWDYKGKKIYNKYGGDFMDAFGNWHFGAVANAYGFNLETSMLGGGGYQVAVQGGGSSAGLAGGSFLWQQSGYGYLMPDSITRALTNGGFTWGDNPGDAINVMNGWDYYNANY